MRNNVVRNRRLNQRQVIPPTLDLQELGAEIKIYGEINDPNMRDINPSIAFHDGQLRIAIRRCNFKVDRLGGWSFRDGCAYSKTEVVYGDLDPDTLQVDNLRVLKLSGKVPAHTQLAGLEDVRLYSRKDGMHAIGFESDRLTRSLHNASASLAEYIIKDDKLEYIRTLEKPVKEAVEKNWSPTDKPVKEFDFTYSPTQVWKDGKLIGQEIKSDLHGGSQLIKQKDGTFLSLVHQKYQDYKVLGKYDKYKYVTYLAEHDKNGFITKLSKGFTFGTLENIEFASGMVEYYNDFIITFGIRDCKWAVCKIPKEALTDLLVEFKPVDK